ncbi:hypothetical protein [Carboxylicivirga sp. RSCT41]|uniref:hypothetical protein n=1 Tax=Carboxylicivirga agarovorans TaxID=3417570 RepID=UPI003D32E570
MHKPIPITQTAIVHPAIHMMQQWQLFMDGIDRIMTFYPSEDQDMMEGLEWNRQLSESLMPVIIAEDVNSKLLSAAKEKADYQWMRPELLPFMQQQPVHLNQLNLFSESAYLVLLVRIQTAKTSILSYLFYRNDTSNFGISDGQARLDTSHKAIIGKMASRFAQMTIENYLASKTQEESFRRHTRNILEHKQIEVSKGKEALVSWKINWLDTYLNDLSRRDGVNYVISETAQQKLLNKDLSFEECKQSIDNCISYICNLFMISPGDDVMIEEDYMILEQNTAVIKSDHAVEILQSRSSKTMRLLDRLEESAYKLQHQGLSITSADVGANMAKPITAPAISDALRKNRVRILQLLEQYPQRWQTIRQSFKPITNLITKNNQRLSTSG